MSFKPEISSVLIFNEALAMVPANPVQSQDERSLEARECRRFYKSIVAHLLERHHWNLATKRKTLAAIANDRTSEWSYAYAKPDDMAFPVNVMPQNGGSYSGLMMKDYAYYTPRGLKLFEQVGNTFYSMIDVAVLEYTSFDITEGDFTVSLKDSIVEHLAAKVIVPISKNYGRARELESKAEFNLLRAMARDLNRNQPTYGDRPTESEIVRGVGYDASFMGSGHPIDPVALPAETGN
jgi:hypothetical protein